MKWTAPRELLWAVIAGLVIAVVSLWPSHYPYSQAPKIDSQRQFKNAVSGQETSDHAPTAQVNEGRQAQNNHGVEHAQETTFLSIKPGEWLLGIVTWMLWMATVGLVKGADRTAERQLRAYISVEPAHFDFKRGTNKAILCVARFKIKNSGQTPAYNVRIDTDFRVAPWPLTGDLATLQKNAIQFNRSIGPNDFVPGGAEKGQNIANAGPTDRLYLLGRISYRDAFEKERETWFCGSIKQSAVLFDQPFVPHSLQIDFAWAERHNEAT